MVALPPELEVLSFDSGVITTVDQTLLPESLEFLKLTSVAQVAEAIRSLRVRGAPLVGIAGAYGTCIGLQADDPDGIRDLRNCRPTAINLARAVDRVLASVESGGLSPLEQAKAIHAEEVAACDAIASNAAAVLTKVDSVMTYCNTGALATAGIGTAFGAIRRAWELGSVTQVWVPETRPLLQGSRLTAWELGLLGIAHTVITESGVASVMADGGVDAVIVGADRITANGDTANKTGTLMLAILASRYRVPFYVAAPTSTIDADTPTGEQIVIEQRSAGEVGNFAGVRTAPQSSKVANPAFDVTPAELITAIITQRGVHRPDQLPLGAGLAEGTSTGTTASSPPAASR